MRQTGNFQHESLRQCHTLHS